MLQNIKDKILKHEKIAGVAAKINTDSSVQYSYVLLAIEKGKIKLVAQAKNWLTIEELKAELLNDYPIVIQIDGKGFLHKKLEESIANDSKVVSKIIPNAKDDDFYLQQFSNKNGQHVSIVRKNQLDELLHTFYKTIKIPLAISFGGFSIEIIIPFLESTLNQQNLGSYTIHSIDNEINTISVSTENELQKTKIEDDYISNNAVVAYAVGLQFLLKNGAYCTQIASINQENSDWQEKSLFKKAGMGMLVFFLVILLVNFALFTLWSDKNKTLQQARFGSGNYYSLIESVQNQLSKKESFLTKVAWNTPSKISFYADRLAATVPTSIKLTQMQIMPSEEVIENEIKKTIFQQNTILINGSCSNPTELNTWIKSMDEFNWIEQVKLNDYLFDSREHVANFKLYIKVKN